MSSKLPRILIADDHILLADLCRRLLDTEFEVVGIAVWTQVKVMLPLVKLLFLAINGGIDPAAEAFRRGASGYLLKTCTALEMMTAVHEVLRGKPYMSRALCRDEVNHLRRKRSKHLEEGERWRSCCPR